MKLITTYDLNEADFTADSWRALQDKLTEARNIINEQQNNVARKSSIPRNYQ